MPRKSTASTADPSAPSHVFPTSVPPHVDGDTSIVSTTTDISPNAKPTKTSTKADKADADNTGIDDLLLPRTLTSRLARGTLPPNTSIQKDALLALTKAASVFISYLASHANEATTKKTIGPADVIKALQEIEMAQVMGIGEVGTDGNVGGRLERELEVWEGVVRGKRKGYREKVKMRESGVSGEGDGGGEEGGEREPKRVRVEEEDGAEMDNGSGEKQTMASHAGSVSHGQALTNGAGNGQTSDDVDVNVHDDEGEGDDDDDGEDEAYDEESASVDGDGDGDGDETQPDEEDDPDDDDDDDDEPAPDEDDVDGFGPGDQLRHDINGEQTGDESE